MLSVSHPAGLPELFLDRSLGRIKVPGLLRAEGLRLTTLSEHYGVPADEAIADEEWLELAGSQGWVVLMKDRRIRYRPHERGAIERFGVRGFCLAGQNLPAEEMAARLLRSLPQIAAACQDPGPFLYNVYKDRIQKVELGARS
jgi:hypothetical protein